MTCFLVFPLNLLFFLANFVPFARATHTGCGIAAARYGEIEFFPARFFPSHKFCCRVRRQKKNNREKVATNIASFPLLHLPGAQMLGFVSTTWSTLSCFSPLETFASTFDESPQFVLIEEMIDESESVLNLFLHVTNIHHNIIVQRGWDQRRLYASSS